MRELYLSFLRYRDHYLYIVFLIFSFLLLLNNNSSNILLIRARANDVFSFFFNPIVWYKNTVNLNSEVEILREKNIQLSLKLDGLIQAEIQNKYLKNLLEFKEESLYELKTAKVINLGSGPIFSSITIDLGTDDGITKNLPIITSNGVVGKTILVNKNTTLVQTVNDVNFRISVKILPSESTGIMRFLNNNLFEIREIQKNANISIGNKVVTSGFSKIYPEGLNVGEITEIINTRGSFQKVARSINFYNENSKLYVFVVKERK